MGLSFCFAWLAIWAAFCNKFPSGPFKNTKVGIISSSDGQAKKLMREIQNMIWASEEGLGDFVMQDQKHPLTKTEIHFKKGWVKCFPPTDKAVRGETLDIVIVDEASIVEDEIYNEAIKPTVSKSAGKVIISSTPRGRTGFFYETFDPDDLRDRHEFTRYWFNWKMCEDPIQKRIIREEIKGYEDVGNIKKIEQEYEGSFISDEMSFFTHEQIERGINKDLEIQYENKDASCVIGIDFGGPRAETAITVVGKIKDKITLLFQYSKPNFDYNLLTEPSWEHSIQNLMKRYNVINIVTDDCAAGTQTNQWLEQNGYPLLRFNFRSDQSAGERNRGYYIFRGLLHKGGIQYPDMRNLVSEMRCIQEIKMEVNMRIKAPTNYKDDLVDSFMMACYPFLSSEGSFSSITINIQKAMERINRDNQNTDGRRDLEWGRLKGKDPRYNSFLNKENRGRPNKIQGGANAQ